MGALGHGIAYNVPGAPAHVNLDGATISKIFLGQITNWNDSAIKALNKGADLPNLKITPVFRSDGSGSSYNFTDYLSAVSGTWKSKIGVSTQPAFPAGQGAKGSGGVAGLVSRTSGAIGYVDIAYAVTNHIRFAAVQERPGKFLFPSLRRIQLRLRLHEGAGEQRDAHRQPAEVGGARLSDQHLHLRDRPQADRARGRAAEDDLLGADAGQTPKYAAKLIFAPLSTVKPVLVASEKTLKPIHLSRTTITERRLRAPSGPRPGRCSGCAGRDRGRRPPRCRRPQPRPHA